MTGTSMEQLLQELMQSADNTTTMTEDWSQGRSAFGGISTALAVTGIRKQLQDEPPMRSLLVSFIGPIGPGPVTVDATIQRQGKNVTQAQASVISDGKVCLQAMGIFGQSRPGKVSATAPGIEPISRERGLDFSAHRKRLPAFLEKFEGYWMTDALPFSGNTDRHLNIWARHRQDPVSFPVEKLVAIADVPPPVVLSWFETPPVPASSLTWALEFVKPPAEIHSEWFYLDYEMEAAADGYSQQSGRIYSEDGELCALSRQCMVYFG
ncbi:MAG: thioesterase family protein [Gammaproteobacteria bacterium]